MRGENGDTDIHNAAKKLGTTAMVGVGMDKNEGIMDDLGKMHDADGKLWIFGVHPSLH
jgi:hypothetical protein